MKNHILFAAVASLALMPAAFAAPQKSGAAMEQGSISAADQTFVDKAAVGGMFEVESSKLAKKHASSAEVKDFADMMIKDHGKANDELAGAAKKLGANVPSKLDAKHEQMLQMLGGMKDADFDRAYIKAQTDAHKEAIALYSSYSKSKGNAELTAWAGETLPTLEMHAQHIQKLGMGGMAEGGKMDAGHDTNSMGRASTKGSSNDSGGNMGGGNKQ